MERRRGERFKEDGNEPDNLAARENQESEGNRDDKGHGEENHDLKESHQRQSGMMVELVNLPQFPQRSGMLASALFRAYIREVC